MTVQTRPDLLTLSIGGRAYGGWASARVSRGIDRCATDFDFEVSERWAGEATPWRINPFDPCVVAVDGAPILTGYVDDVRPMIDGTQHSVRICGRSKTEDLIDCKPDIAGGQFSGFTLAAIARAVSAPFGIGVIDASGGLANNTFGDASLERGETAFAFLERLGRLSGVLLSDDVNGNLVLTTAGAARAAGSLIQGRNISVARAELTSRHRFSDYIVKGQHALGSPGGTASWSGAGGVGGGTAPPPSTVQTAQEAVAHDASVPRYRPCVVLAESMLTGAGMQLRANWLMQSAFGRSTSAEITVAGWRQPDGTLWTVNQIVPVTAPVLGVDRDLLIAGVSFQVNSYHGRVTILRVGPVEAFTPDPGEVKIKKHGGRRRGRGGSPNWNGAGDASGGTAA